MPPLLPQYTRYASFTCLATRLLFPQFYIYVLEYFCCSDYLKIKESILKDSPNLVLHWYEKKKKIKT